MKKHHLYLHFASHLLAVDCAILNGWSLQSTEPMERGVMAHFIA